MIDLTTYDWQSVLSFAAGTCLGGASDCGTPKRVDGETCTEAVFSESDIAIVLDSSEGERDGARWMIAGLLRDGRYFYIEAGCDYTGWDCQCGGTSWVADSLNSLLRGGLTDEARERLPGVESAARSGAYA